LNADEGSPSLTTIDEATPSSRLIDEGARRVSLDY
jgi:hypothetical protein